MCEADELLGIIAGYNQTVVGVGILTGNYELSVGSVNLNSLSCHPEIYCRFAI